MQMHAKQSNPWRKSKEKQRLYIYMFLCRFYHYPVFEEFIPEYYCKLNHIL